MKRWAVLTVALYLVVLALLTVPVVLLCLGEQWGHRGSYGMRVSPAEAFGIFGGWGYWIWLAVLGASQALLLLVPVKAAEGRLKARRPVLVPIITASFLLANLFATGVFAFACLLFDDDAFKYFEALGQATGKLIDAVPSASNALNQLNLQPNDETFIALSTVGSTLAVCWLIWGFVFYRFAREDGPESLVKRITRWLLRGSILELLVAVPSHIVVRHRDSCCAPGGTFWGITTGLSVMLLAFGPGVFFLFVERFRRLRPGNGGHRDGN